MVTQSKASKASKVTRRVRLTGRAVVDEYRPDLLQVAHSMCRLGATDMELADGLGICLRTLYKWKNIHHEFNLAMQVGKEEADSRVTRALYQRAVGYTFNELQYFNVNKELVPKTVRKHIPPDVTAQIFWLKNRRRHDWRQDGNLPREIESPATLANVETQLLAKLFGIIERHSAAEVRQIEGRAG